MKPVLTFNSIYTHLSTCPARHDSFLCNHSPAQVGVLAVHSYKGVVFTKMTGFYPVESDHTTENVTHMCTLIKYKYPHCVRPAEMVRSMRCLAAGATTAAACVPCQAGFYSATTGHLHVCLILSDGRWLISFFCLALPTAPVLLPSIVQAL